MKEFGSLPSQLERLLVVGFKDRKTLFTWTLKYPVQLSASSALTKKDAAIFVLINPYKNVPFDSLQNLSDYDAGYCAPMKTGYQMQVMEVWLPDESHSVRLS